MPSTAVMAGVASNCQTTLKSKLESDFAAEKTICESRVKSAGLEKGLMDLQTPTASESGMYRRGRGCSTV